MFKTSSHKKGNNKFEEFYGADDWKGASALYVHPLTNGKNNELVVGCKVSATVAKPRPVVKCRSSSI